MEKPKGAELAATDARDSRSNEAELSSKSSETPNKPSEMDYTSKSEKKTQFGDYFVRDFLETLLISLTRSLILYQRVFTYTTLADRITFGLATLGQIGTGATLPLMIIVFGMSLPKSCDLEISLT